MVPVHYVTTEPEGDRDAVDVVLVHGAWHAGWCWEPFSEFLVDRGFRTHAIDLRGHGSSPGNIRRARIRDYVDDVAGVAAGFDTPPVLIGHSMGGLVVQHYLARHPAPAGVLLAPVPTRGAIGATMRAVRKHPGAFLRSNLTLSLGPMVDDPDRAADLLFRPSSNAEVVARTVGRLQTESYWAYLDMIFKRPQPHHVDAPVLVVGARDDALFSVGELEETARKYGSEAVIVEGIGHDLMLDDGWERVASVVVDWLGALDLGS